MPLRNFDPLSLKAEANSMEYLNIPRTSLSVRELMERALRGAPMDAVDMTSSFESHDDDENDFSTTPYMDDRVDVHEQADALENRIRSRARRRAAKSEDETSANGGKSKTSDGGNGGAPEGGGENSQL